MRRKASPGNEDLIDYLKEEGVIGSKAVERAMRAVDRAVFVPPHLLDSAYGDHPLQIGHGQTISAPHMVAIMAHELHVRKGNRVLEIGTGSGYHAAVIAKMVGRDGVVFSIEVVPELAEMARSNLERAGIRNVTVLTGDGSVGLPDKAPFDRIYYTCAAPNVPPVVLEQVEEGGMVLGVVGPRYSTQRLVRFKRSGGRFTQEPLTYCIFVPLVGKLGQ